MSSIALKIKIEISGWTRKFMKVRTNQPASKQAQDDCGNIAEETSMENKMLIYEPLTSADGRRGKGTSLILCLVLHTKKFGRANLMSERSIETSV
ncbi:unnamed protein product [Caenorhabditis auriculariae]|uniref:Uncharacterized protein n=1 Tax=Caenorhabditis auriculariae TaxID=2777116 RepID=A0A8S1GLZ1_9PELO|nr:unnamed protein product [Caenorhabditis auriculariae]